MLNFLGAMVLFAMVYWLIGVTLFAFFAHVYVHHTAPLAVKLAVVWRIGWVMPTHFLSHGSKPFVTIYPEGDPLAEEDVKRWVQSKCPCPSCRARRGED